MHLSDHGSYRRIHTILNTSLWDICFAARRAARRLIRRIIPSRARRALASPKQVKRTSSKKKAVDSGIIPLPAMTSCAADGAAAAGVSIGVSSADDVRLAVEWAAQEQWNPGMTDALAFQVCS